MFTYTYNLRELGYSEEDYEKTAKKALSLARGASAVDTGRFRRSWTAKVDGDILTVSNTVRYAPYVELGSIVYRFHRYKVRDALSRLGLSKGTESFGSGTKSKTFGKSTSPRTGTETGVPSGTEEVLQSSSSAQAITIPTLTEQEIRSPALLLNRFRTSRATTPTAPQTITPIPKAQLFNRSRLLELIIAAEIANQTLNNEE